VFKWISLYCRRQKCNKNMFSLSRNGSSFSWKLFAVQHYLCSWNIFFQKHIFSVFFFLYFSAFFFLIFFNKMWIFTLFLTTKFYNKKKIHKVFPWIIFFPSHFPSQFKWNSLNVIFDKSKKDIKTWRLIYLGWEMKEQKLMAFCLFRRQWQ
jgi:hypothetical protein